MEQHNIVRVLTAIGVPRSDISDGPFEVVVRCPLAKWRHEAKVDRRASMSIKVNPVGPSVGQCWSCGFKMRSLARLVEAVQMHRDDLDLTKVMMEVALLEVDDLGRAVSALPPYDGPQEVGPQVYDESLLDEWKNKVHPSVLQRGVTIDSCRRWGLGHDKFRKRTILPLRDPQGRLVGVSGRSNDPDRQPKYLNYTGLKWGDHWSLSGAVPREEPFPEAICPFPKSLYLFGGHLVGPRMSAVLVEGQFSAILTDQVLQQQGLDEFYVPLAFMGNQLHAPDQVDALIELVDEVILFTDNDEAGDKAHEKAVRDISSRISVKGVTYPEDTRGKDPGNLAIECPEILVQMILGSHPISS